MVVQFEADSCNCQEAVVNTPSDFLDRHSLRLHHFFFGYPSLLFRLIVLMVISLLPQPAIGQSTGSDDYLVDCLLSCSVNKKLFFVYNPPAAEPVMWLAPGVKVSYLTDSSAHDFKRYQVLFENQSDDTIVLENVVPYGEQPGHVYITASGPWNLARARLFLPGKSPVGIILPDNAWEMGFGMKGKFMAMARRTSWEKAIRKRYETHLLPGGNVRYTLWERPARSTWQASLRRFCQDDYLFDLPEFNDSLYHRPDLAWIRKAYLIVLQFAWDRAFVDPVSGSYRLTRFLNESRCLIGHYDVFGLWPTWPRLGLDERNQWDMYRALPGGLNALRQQADSSRQSGTRFFIAWNPWDQSTRAEHQLQGLASLIQTIGADGVVLDTRGSSSLDLQRSADSVRKGVVMYSEGMAVVNDMPGIISGRVHDAIYMPPPLNINKFIRPDFSIFRVCQLSQGHIHREAAISLFNGYGLEINTFAPGRPDWTPDELSYLGRVLRVLRENHSNFIARDWLPLLPVATDSIWVNAFPGATKTIYTVLSLDPSGYEGALIPVIPHENSHYVSLWHHEELDPRLINGSHEVKVSLEPYYKSWKDTRREGSVDVVAALPVLIETRLSADSLVIDQPGTDTVKVWAGNPTYSKEPVVQLVGDTVLHIPTCFGLFEGKIVIQLFQHGELADERIVGLKPGTARMISFTREVYGVGDASGMAKIPGGEFTLKTGNSDQFIPYPADSVVVRLKPYWIDIYPVTNGQYTQFIRSSGYQPMDCSNFLKHWQHGICPDSLLNHPVVWVSRADAEAYARWAKKRLPTEAEWQKAASGPDGSDWPWGSSFDSLRCNVSGNRTYAVDHFGEKGQSFSGVRDLVGNVWQITADQFDNGAYRYTILKGGSYWNPTASWWYIQGGAQPVSHRQMWLHVAPGFDRSATVGFRCARDVD